MSTKKIILILLIICGVIPASAYGGDSVSVFASILPQQHFIEKIGGDRVTVSVMVAPGASPATYEPKPAQMADLAASAIYFAVGVPFESVWLERFSKINPNMQIVYTQEGIEKMPMTAHGHDAEAPRHHQDAHDGIRDPHIWLSPPLVLMQAANIFRALTEVMPRHRKELEERYLSFIREVAELDVFLTGLFSGSDHHKSFMVFHPSWGYFAKAYGLEQIPVEIEGKSPKPAELQKLIVRGKARGIRTIFVQPQYSDKKANVIARAIGGQVVTADPLAADWSENLRRTAQVFSAALQKVH